MKQSDEELIARCRKKDLVAFQQLVERYRDKLMAFIYSMVRNYHLAEDIFQETFIRVYRKADRFRDGYPFKTWLYTIAANLCRDELRRVKRKPTIELDAPIAGPEENGNRSRMESLNSGGPTPRQEAGARELEEIFQKGLVELSPEHRQVVIMNRVMGLKYREIAEVLGIPSGTVRSRIHYAIEYLKKKMEKDGLL